MGIASFCHPARCYLSNRPGPSPLRLLVSRSARPSLNRRSTDGLPPVSRICIVNNFLPHPGRPLPHIPPDII